MRILRDRTLLRFLTNLCSTCLLFGLVSSASAGDTGDRETARRHLKMGVTLYNEHNYEAALVEFEASMREMPSASALQNVALCQTKLFRYVEAITALDALQAQFTLSREEAAKVSEARKNLAQLIGRLELRVTPSNAIVTIKGKPYSVGDYPWLQLSSGAYRIEISAPNHVSQNRTVKIAGGQSQTLTVNLTRAVGTLTVRVNDEEAAIALDRVPLAFGTWTGEVPEGEHILQIYKRGHVTMSTTITVTTGDRMDLQLPLGPEKDAAPGYDLAGLPYRTGKRTRSPLDPDTGWFGLLTASSLAVLRSPDGFEADDDADVIGGSFGLRAGYRFSTYVGLEGVFDTSSQSVSGTWFGTPRTYDLTSRRFGGNVRVLLGGKSIRFSGTFGVGGVWHRLDLGGQTYSGTNSYFGLELGPQLNAGQVLLEGVAQVYLEGANNMRNGETRIYTERTVLPQVGLGLRVGFSQWGTW